jgi:hypothetical protein
MAKKFDELRRKMSPERVKANKANSERQLLMMSLQELRQGVDKKLSEIEHKKLVEAATTAIEDGN